MFCPSCGKQVAEDQPFCHHCGARLLDSHPGQTASGSTGSPTPWENRDQLGLLRGLLGTMKGSLFTPAEFFRAMPISGGLANPLLYAMIVGMAGIMGFYFWDSLLHDSMRTFMSQEMRAAAGEHGVFQGTGASFAAVMTPFALILWLFITSGMLHLVLLMVRGAGSGFEATFRVVAYSMTPVLCLILPVCGSPIAGIWVVIISMIGLREAHKTSGGKAAFAVFFPFLFCCGILILFVVLFMGALAASFSAVMHSYR